MGRFLIIKMGAPPPGIESRHGIFADWIGRGLGVARDALEIVDVVADEPLPDMDQYAGVVLTGSAAMVTDHLPWSDRVADWLGASGTGDTPILGICYGHQLLGDVFGGSVAQNPKGREIGTITVDLTSEAQTDPLFSALPSPLVMQATHMESLITLPENGVRLAGNSHDPNQAFRIGESVWGIQFHPEMSAEIICEYIDARREAIAAEGLDPDAQIRSARDSLHGARLLTRFAQLAASR